MQTSDGKTLTGIRVEIAKKDRASRNRSWRGSDDDSSVGRGGREGERHVDHAGRANESARESPTVPGLGSVLDRDPRRRPGPRKELQPSPTLLAFTLPEYEQHLDHAGLISQWNDESLKRGEAIYRRVCVNCHGTKDAVGSLPTSLRFAEGKFKNGCDPWSMYQTLTRGFGMMAPQSWMVPSQKYDVIHFIREQYLRRTTRRSSSTSMRRILLDYPRATHSGPSRAKSSRGRQ